MSELVELDDYRNPGNGAREVLQRYFEGQTVEGIDHFLAWLWVEGFQVVPCAGENAANADD